MFGARRSVPRGLGITPVANTIERLALRIEERFPGRGLGQQARELHSIAEGVERGLSRRAQLTALRWVFGGAALLGGLLVIVMIIVVFVRAGGDIGALWRRLDVVSLFVAMGQGGVLAAFAGVTRLARRRALDQLSELRAFAHIVDMHQLTKDPTAVLTMQGLTATSPQRSMTAFELSRYLDYCSELLSLIGKLATIYAERTSDHVVIQDANELQALTVGMNQNIFQKITFIQLSRLETAIAKAENA